MRLKLDFEHEERRLEHEEAQRARDAEKAAREAVEAEQEKALLAAEIKAKKEAAPPEHELKMASLGKHSPSDRASTFGTARNIRLVPPL